MPGFFFNQSVILLLTAYHRESNIHRKWEFPGSPVVRTPSFHCRGAGLIPGWETKILHAARSSQRKKTKNKTTYTKSLSGLL